MTLALEIEYLSGVSFAAVGPDSDTPDWPPQPDRIFSALVATWAARGQRGDEQQALEWLEGLPPPRLLASEAEARSAHTAYVPPNDYEVPNSELSKLRWYRDFLSRGAIPPEKGGHQKPWLQTWNVMPDQRKRSGLKERTFPACRPHDPVVLLHWPEAAPERETLASLQLLAQDTTYVGHSASLTRCRFLADWDVSGSPTARSPDRWVYPGRFAELRRAFESKRRPAQGALVGAVARTQTARVNVFGEHWLVLEHVSGEMPDLRACALVAKSIRDTLLSGYQRIGLGNAIPEVVSGHDASTAPARIPHLAIIPLPFAGFAYADGHVMGFALVPPRDSSILDDSLFRKALRTLAPIDERRGRRLLTVSARRATGIGEAFSIALSPTFEVSKQSLDPAAYIGRHSSFATVTPIALDRHLKEIGRAREIEITAQIAAACRNIGLPEPEKIVTDKHSAIEGAPSAHPSANSPSWMRWRLPQSLASRQLIHAVISFPEPVDGPVILGAGRFLGLGLCRPLHSGRQ